MKELPIIFSGEMVRAILEGRKTQTRRVIKPQPRNVWGSGIRASLPERFCLHGAFYQTEVRIDKWLPCPYGQPGDRLWVKESFAIESNAGIDDEDAYPPP